MKALVAYQPGELRFIEVEKPVPGPREVLVKVARCGICGTDVAIAGGTLTLGDGADPIYPVRIGHEWSGVVVEVGSETRKLKVGDRVNGDTGWNCGECEDCLAGESYKCVNGRAVATVGECWPGAFAEYMLMPERLTHKVPDNVSLDEAAMIEPSIIGFCGLRRSQLGPGKTFLVTGTGPIGLAGMACGKAIGCGKTLLAGRKDKKLAIGKEMGADVLVNTTKENLLDAVMRETNGRGVDVILDTTGDADLLNDLFLMLCPGGELVIPGFYEKTLTNVKLDRIITKNCKIIGAAGESGLGVQIMDMISNGHMNLMPMLTEHYSFEQAMEAFAAVKAHNDRRVKIMVDFD